MIVLLTRSVLFRTLLGAVAATALTVTAACGGDGGSSGAAADNPYDLLQAGTLRAGTLTDAPPNVYLASVLAAGFPRWPAAACR